MNKERVILGIDPGTVVMGYGVIAVKGKEIRLVAAGVLKLNTETEHYDRLKKIFDTILQLIEEHIPDEMAIEEPFFGKNVQSMLKLGRAQGVAIAAALYRQIPVFGYSPRRIKQSITGRGAASKEQVAIMLQGLLNFEEQPKFLDATDALGVAVCHSFQNNIIASKKKSINPAVKGSKKSYGGWGAFLTDNPDRLKKK
ncbi:crossover junction endodeoxyribonuclease RuvC [soil metagenome]